MKKIFSMFFAAFFAVAMMAGGAMAASTVSDGVVLGDNMTPTALVDLDTEVYPSEKVDKTDGNTEAIVSTGDAGAIAFKLGANVGNNSDITISLTNTTFGELLLPGDNFYLAVYAEDADTILATHGTFVSAAGVGGVFSNTVTFTTNAALPKDTIVVMVADDDGDPLLGVYGDYDLLCNASLAGSAGDITASVTVAGVSAANGSAKIQSYTQQLVLQADDGALGDIGEDVVDVNEDRLKFVGALLDADDSGIAISKTAGDFNGPVVAADINKVTLVIVGDFSAITDPESDVVFATSDSFTKTYNATAGTLTCVTTDATDIAAMIASQLLTITVDGSTILATRTFTVTGSVDMDSSDFLDTEFATPVTWAKWSINGYQATMPLLLQSGVQKTFIKFYNKSTTEAEVFVDVKNADGTGAETLTLASIPAGQVGSYNAADIIAVSTGLAEGTQFTATFTITVPPADVVGTAFFNLVGSGTRALVLQ